MPATDPAILRILDANANRTREALRVLEDYARFALDDDVLSRSLKELRHALVDATREFIDAAILCRDSSADVGKDNKTDAEMRRSNLGHVVTAAGKRLGEALRALEEFAKVASPGAAARIEVARYRWYELEQTLARTLRDRNRLAGVRLCVLITESACRRPWREVVEAAIAGGADCLQLREKTLEGAELLRRARELVALCRRRDVISIINDRPDIALLSGADGVHVGQGDLPAAEVRKLVGPDRIVGVSTHHPDQARQAVRDGADYIGVGPIFPSATKPRDFIAGLPYAAQVVRTVPIPALAIAGITEQNLAQVLETGIRAIAVTAAVTGCDDPRAATERLKAAISKPF